VIPADQPLLAAIGVDERQGGCYNGSRRAQLNAEQARVQRVVGGHVAPAAVGPSGGGQRPLIHVEARKGAQQHLGPRLPVREAAAREYCLGPAALLGRYGLKAKAHGAVVRRVAATRNEFAEQSYHEHVEAAALVPDAKFGPQRSSRGARHARHCRQVLVNDRFVLDPWARRLVTAAARHRRRRVELRQDFGRPVLGQDCGRDNVARKLAALRLVQPEGRLGARVGPRFRPVPAPPDLAAEVVETIDDLDCLVVHVQRCQECLAI
jgi:hypothetical protein